MPLYAYCPHSTCAAKIAYDTIKPTVCPQCRKTFASAFAVTPPAPVVAPAPQDDPDDRPFGRAALTAARKTTTVVKSRPGRPEPSRLMNAPAAELPEEAIIEEEGDLDPREARRQARELAATIDTSTIHIADQDDGVFRFGDMWAEGASARESAAKAKPAKRKARR